MLGLRKYVRFMYFSLLAIEFDSNNEKKSSFNFFSRAPARRQSMPLAESCRDASESALLQINRQKSFITVHVWR